MFGFGARAAARAKVEADARAAEKAAFLSALDAVVRITTSQSDAVQATCAALQTWLKMFMVQGSPRSSAPTDLTEAIAEGERLRELAEQGYPVTLSEADQIKWVLEQENFPPVPDLLA